MLFTEGNKNAKWSDCDTPALAFPRENHEKSIEKHERKDKNTLFKASVDVSCKWL